VNFNSVILDLFGFKLRVRLVWSESCVDLIPLFWIYNHWPFCCIDWLPLGVGSQMGSSSFDCLFDGGGAGSFSGFIESDKSDSLSWNKLNTSLTACLRPMFLQQRTTIISDLKT